MKKHLLSVAVASVAGFAAAFAADPISLDVSQSSGSLSDGDRVWTSAASPAVTVSMSGGTFISGIAEANGSLVMNTACETRTITIATSDPGYYVSGFSIDVRGVQKDQVTFTCGSVSVTTPATDGTELFAVGGFTPGEAVSFTITPNVAENKKAILDNFVVEIAPVAPSIYVVKENVGWVASASSITEDNSSVTGPYTYAKAIDGDAGTYWASSYQKTHPHTFCVDMGADTKVGGFEYMARQDRAAANGVDRLNEFRVYVTAEPVDGFDFSGTDPVFEGSLENTQDLQRVEFGANFTGRYFYLQSQSAVNAGGGASACFSMAELRLLQGYASEAEVEIGAVSQKIDAVKALAATYKANCPFAAEVIDGLLDNLAQYSAEFIYEVAKDMDMTIDEMIASMMVAPLEEAVVEAANAVIGTQVAVTFYQPGQGAWLSAREKATNKGWNSFNYYPIPVASAAWTLEPAGAGSFCLKSAAGTYVATPEQHYARVVADKADAAEFTFGVADGYVTMAPVSLPGTLLGLDGKNDPLEVMSETDGSRGYLWAMAPYEAIGDGDPRYCVFGSKRNAGRYLADFNEKIESTLNSSVLGTTGLYCTDQVSANMLWVVTDGYTDGSVFVKNYVTGRYLVDFVTYCDSTSLDPVDITLVANGNDGIMIHGVHAGTNIDANNFNFCVGHWQYGGDGSVWYDETVDMTKGETAEEALDYHFNVAAIVGDARAAVEVYRNTLPGSAELVDEALAELDALVDPDGLKEKVEKIVAGVADDVYWLFVALAEEETMVTFTNVRRLNESKPSLLAAAASDAGTVFNTIGSPLPAALWTVVPGDIENTYMLLNALTGSYVGAAGASVDEADAQAFTVTVRDNGTLNFTQAADGSDLLNMDSGTGNLTFWYDTTDGGSQWQLGSIDHFEVDDEGYFVEWDGVVDYGGMFATTGNALTSCGFTIEAANVEWSGLGMAAVLVYDNAAQDFVMADSEVDKVEYDAASGKATVTLSKPLTDYAFHVILFGENAFVVTAADGSVTYSPMIESDLAFVVYVPDQEAALSVTPEAGEVKELGVISFDMPGAQFFDVSESDGVISVSKDGTEIFSADTDTFYYDNYNEETGKYEIVLNQSAAGKYTLSVPEGFFLGSTGYNAALTVEWTITETGVAEVNVSGLDGAPARIYDLKGRRLSRAMRGVNIIDGVKTVVRK